MKQKFNEYISEPKRADQAEIWKRIIAYLIDHFLVVLLVFLTVVPLVIIERKFGLREWFMMVVTFVDSVGGAAYLFFKDAWDGRGVGKRVMGLQVVDFHTNAPVNWKIAALRYLMLRLLSLVEIIFIFVQPNHRGIGDWLGHSIVVKRQ